jgi:hypothetical protein
VRIGRYTGRYTPCTEVDRRQHDFDSTSAAHFSSGGQGDRTVLGAARVEGSAHQRSREVGHGRLRRRSRSRAPTPRCSSDGIVVTGRAASVRCGGGGCTDRHCARGHAPVDPTNPDPGAMERFHEPIFTTLRVFNNGAENNVFLDGRAFSDVIA